MCIKSVMASTEGSFDDGVSKEKEYSRVLFGSGQAQALQYAFFAQRAATKVRLFVRFRMSPDMNLKNWRAHSWPDT